MRIARPIYLIDGSTAITVDVWAMLVASRTGDIATIRQFLASDPRLATAQYDYAMPLHMAVIGGHVDAVRLLLDAGGIDPTAHTHPFQIPLATVADERGFTEVADLLRAAIADSSLHREWKDAGRIERGFDAEHTRFQDAVDQGQRNEVASMLATRPSLATDADMFWGEGVLAMPVKDGDFEMADLLMRHGARVPGLSKWGKEYYFKRLDGAQFLLERGMNPHHQTWRGVTLLHDMAWTAQAEKASLLLDHGADMHAIDGEFQSTPLGLAARWGREDVIQLLLDRGADPKRAGAPWATPVAWAERHGLGAAVELLKRAGG